MKLSCEASGLTDSEKSKMVNLLRSLHCHPMTDGNSVQVEYEGPLSEHALAIIVAVEASGCHRVVMTSK